jgi:1,5-anhydro-D-fructose reductase (1,5-anhydro-D-mannitol-forming)
MSTSQTLGWGLIGASDIARTRMAAAIADQPDSEVVAVMSSQMVRAQSFASELGIPRAYDDLDAMLADPRVNIVYISTTNNLHCAQTLAAARAGKHVLCEKPLALSVEDATAMVDACRAAGVVLGTNHHLRNAATHRTIRRLVADGVIGQPLAARVFHAVYLPPRLQGWRLTDPTAGGGVILDITVHDADTLRFDLSDEVVEAVALTAQQGLAAADAEDAVMGVLRFDRGTLAQFHDAFTVRHAPTGFEILGTHGSLIGVDVMTQDPRGRVVLRRENHVEEVDVGEREDVYVRSVGQFVAAVHGEGTPAATGEDGLASLAIALAVRSAARSGERTTVAHPTPPTLPPGSI